MIKNLFFFTILLLVNRYLLKIDDGLLYASVQSFVEAYQGIFSAVGSIVAIFLIIISYAFTSIGLYKIAYLISNIVKQLSEILISFLAVANLFFWYTLGQNFLKTVTLGPIVATFVLLISSSLSMRIIDFNYRSQSTLLLHAGLIIISASTVGWLGPFLFP